MTTRRRRPTSLGRHLLAIYRRLLEHYGPQGWWPGDGPFETIVGAILTQNTAWKNVERALSNLKAARGLDPDTLHHLAQGELAHLIRPSGYFQAKARKLKAFVDYLFERYEGNLETLLRQDHLMLRAELLGVYGIGPETADAILLYAAGVPSFVIDAYTKRIATRLGLSPARHDYHAFQALFQDNLPTDAPLFNEYHALLDRHAKETCRKTPLCQGCCLLELCPMGQRWREFYWHAF